MKKTFILFISLVTLSNFAQNQILPIEERIGGEYQEGAYYKDLNNVFGPLEGTWAYINGGTTLRIKLRKIIMDYDVFLSDVLIGEYQYIENGVPLINTLSQFNSNYPNQSGHNIFGKYFLEKEDKPICVLCAVGEKRVSLRVKDVPKQSVGSIYIRPIAVNGLPAMELQYYATGLKSIPYNPSTGYSDELVGSTIRKGIYILMKE